MFGDRSCTIGYQASVKYCDTKKLETCAEQLSLCLQGFIYSFMFHFMVGVSREKKKRKKYSVGCTGKSVLLAGSFNKPGGQKNN